MSLFLEAPLYLRTFDAVGRIRRERRAEVDHITSLRAGGAEFDPDNLQGLCHSCHLQRTRREMRLNNAPRH